jgi:hypothetical protein
MRRRGVQFGKICTNGIKCNILQIDMVAETCNVLHVFLHVLVTNCSHLHVIFVRDPSIGIKVGTTTQNQDHLLLVVLTNVVETFRINNIELIQ